MVTDNSKLSPKPDEKFFSSFMELCPTMAWVKDLEGKFVFVNRAFREKFGLQRDYIGLTDFDILDEDIALRVRSDDLEVMTNNSSKEIFEEISLENGEVRHLQTLKFPFENSLGERNIGGFAIDHTDRVEFERALHLRNLALEALSEGITITDPFKLDNPIIYCNPGFERMTGYSREEILGKNCRFLQGTDTSPEALLEIRNAINEKRACRIELLNYRKDGTAFWNSLSISPIKDAQGRLTHFAGVQSDITKLKELEERYHYAQKMESVGQLAGGIAHDFNNLITVISGYSQVIIGGLSEDDKHRWLIQEIDNAGRQAAALTRKLLAFSKREVIAPQHLVVNGIVSEMENLLSRVIGEDIELSTSLDPTLANVRIDPTQLELVIFNLVINARDAMLTGGKIKIETQSVVVDDSLTENYSTAIPGKYVLLSVSDTGTGMPEELKDKVFEPFFTTKTKDKGSGLGLSVVHGIIAQAGGFIKVESELGKGATFKVYLPEATLKVESKMLQSSQSKSDQLSTTVLVTEDEPGLLRLIRHVLSKKGFKVLESTTAEEAIKLASDFEGSIDLLLTDVVMPGMNGRMLAEKLLKLRPEIKVIYMSGYTDDSIMKRGILHQEVTFLQKPFTPNALVSKLDEILNKDNTSVSSADIRS